MKARQLAPGDHKVLTGLGRFYSANRQLDDLAAIGRDVSRYEIEKRGFSGSIRADESGDRTAFDPE